MLTFFAFCAEGGKGILCRLEAACNFEGNVSLQNLLCHISPIELGRNTSL